MESDSVIKFTIRQDHLQQAQVLRESHYRSGNCPVALALGEAINYKQSVAVGFGIATLGVDDYSIPLTLQAAIRYWDEFGDTNFEQVLNKEWELTPLLRRKNYETSD